MDLDEELAADRELDPNALDVACLNQPELFYKWSERAIAAEHEFDQAQFTLSVKNAELNLLIRDDPEAYGLKNKTEKSIESTAEKHPDLMESHQRMLIKKKRWKKLEAAKKAMEIRKHMIEALIQLHGQQYFAGPSVPRNLGEAWLEFRKEQDERVNRKQGAIARRVRREDD